MTVTGKANIAAANNPGTDWDNPDVYHCALSSRAGSTCYWVPLTVEKATLHYRFYTRVAMSQGCATYASATGTYKAASTPLPLGLDLVLNPGHGPGMPGAASGLSAPPNYGSSGPTPGQSYEALGNVNLQIAMTYTNRAQASACGVTLPSNAWDLSTEFAGSYHPGQTKLDGSEAYSGLGSPRLSWDLAVMATGVEITSPVAGSTIAMTDAHYLSPQPGPDSVAPLRRELVVSGTDTSPGATTVKIGNVSARITSGGTWALRVPVSGAGYTSLSAEDNAGADADEHITLIDLVITSPAEGAVLPITYAPAMPNLGAVASVGGYPGDVDPIVFHWTLSTRGEYRDRCGHDPSADCGQWYAYNTVVGSGATTGRAPWAGNFSTIEGGFGRLSTYAYIPGVQDNPVQSEPRWINIPGTNPSIASITAYVSKQDPKNAAVENELFCHESGFTQFRPYPDPREPATTTVPHGLAREPGLFTPPVRRSIRRGRHRAKGPVQLPLRAVGLAGKRPGRDRGATKRTWPAPPCGVRTRRCASVPSWLRRSR